MSIEKKSKKKKLFLTKSDGETPSQNLEARVAKLEARMNEHDKMIEELLSNSQRGGFIPLHLHSKIKKIRRSKFKCATSGKHSCDECGKIILRGDTLRLVDVKYDDGTEEHLQFCCSKHRNAYCERNNIPQDKQAETSNA